MRERERKKHTYSVRERNTESMWNIFASCICEKCARYD